MELISEESGYKSQTFNPQNIKDPKNIKKYLEDKLYPSLRIAIERVLA